MFVGALPWPERFVPAADLCPAECRLLPTVPWAFFGAEPARVDVPRFPTLLECFGRFFVDACGPDEWRPAMCSAIVVSASDPTALCAVTVHVIVSPASLAETV